MLLDIGTLSTELLSVNSQAVAVCDGLSDGQLAWRPHPGKWSIAENFIHLRITAEIFLPTIDHALAETISSGLISSGPFRLGWYGRLLVWYVEPPPAIRLPAPKALRPSLLGHPSRALGDFLSLQAAMLQRMEDAGGPRSDWSSFRFASGELHQDELVGGFFSLQRSFTQASVAGGECALLSGERMRTCPRVTSSILAGGNSYRGGCSLLPPTVSPSLETRA